MKQRTQLLSIPDNRKYIVIDLPNKGKHVFRLPRFSVAVKLINLIPIERMAALQEIGDKNGMELIDELAEIMDLMAAIIGACWNHVSLELETLNEMPDLRAFGEAVAEELHEADYDIHEISLLFSPIFQALVQSLGPAQNAEEKARDFPVVHGEELTRS
jgi:hypothetical protein